MQINEKLIPKLKNIDVNTQNISNITGKILWTNPDPTKSITSNTNITLSSSNYDFYEVIYRGSIDPNNNERLSTGRIPKGNSTRIFQTYQSSTGNVAVRDRKITFVDDTTLSVGTGLANDPDNTCIPYYIIGYKTGPFS
ncbi:MAG: hypothetical protein Q4E39_03960 [bacterium]|nr:hypothetical protein [bacterium]